MQQTLPTKRGLIFSDVDGTFLDVSYEYPFSEEFLKEVFAHYEIIFSSSRTVLEMLLFQKRLGIRQPFIAENGGVIVFYDSVMGGSVGYPTQLLGEKIFLVPLGFRAIDILPFVKFAVAVTGIHVETMHELSPQTVAEISQYTLDDAKNALTRQYSVAISLRSFRDGEISLFLDSLRYFKCSVSTGGHWMIVTRDTDKGLAADWYRGWLRRNNYNYSIIAGIGNDNNDAPMLRTVDMPFVIRNSSGYAESLASLPSAYLLQSEGTMGWIEMINVLDESTYSSHFTKKHSKKGLA